jgi:hypothetical protein
VEKGALGPLSDCDLGRCKGVLQLRLNASHLNHERHHALRVPARSAALDEVRQRQRAREGDPRIVLLSELLGRVAHLARE